LPEPAALRRRRFVFAPVSVRLISVARMEFRRVGKGAQHAAFQHSEIVDARRAHAVWWARRVSIV